MRSSSPTQIVRPAIVNNIAMASKNTLPLISKPMSPSAFSSNINQKRLTNPFKKQIVGDVFGSRSGAELSMLGLMYRSRVEERKMHVQENVIEENHSDEASVAGRSNNSIDVHDNEVHDIVIDDLSTLNPRQQLAVTIRNWTKIPENDAFIIQEGAIHALIALAGIDDALIKDCCANALYMLSSRPSNREELLSLGAATGVITLSMQIRSWRIAKLCALALANLSMQPEGEATMAKEGAILALVVLFGIKGQRLLPVCVQALYNLTCVNVHFKGMDRITKALLNLPQTNFDHSPFLVKALVNCSQYSWLRLRIIEDGALASLAAMIPTLPTRENMHEIVFYIMTCLRLLSDSSGCRNEMIAKGTVDILNQIFPFCDNRNRFILIKTLHNLMAGTVLSLSAFETAVAIVSMISSTCTDLVTRQYASSCSHLFAMEGMRGSSKLALKIIEILPQFLKSDDSITQLFALGTAGNLLFSNLCTDKAKLEGLIENFVEAGPTVQDPSGIEALVSCLARLTQELFFLRILDHRQLLPSLLDLLLDLVVTQKQSNIVMESFCVAVCHISLRIKDLTPEIRQTIANELIQLLSSDDIYVLNSAVSSIRAFGQHGLCHNEMLSDDLLESVASILIRYNSDANLCRLCCSVLAVFSSDVQSHNGLSSDKVMEVLFANSRAEDNMTRELVATTLCNLSINENARQKMIEKNVVDVLATLSGATSEIIQELCAKCICNITCAVDLHNKIIKNKILQPILMISLVRAVAHSTKQLCARALLNLITDDNLDAIKEAGAIRIFSTLSTIPNLPTQNICAKGFLLFTTTSTRREELIQRRAVLQALFGMVKSSSSRTRIIVGMAVCNLLACPLSQRAAISAGALSVLKIISTMSYNDMKEATARVIVNLAQTTSLHGFLLKEPLVPMLVMILQQSMGYTFDCAIAALSVLSQSEVFRHVLIDKGCVTALVSSIVIGRLSDGIISAEVCRCFCYLSYVRERVDTCIVEGHIMLALHAIFRSEYCTGDAARMIAITIRNLTMEASIRKHIVNQGVFELMLSCMKDFAMIRTVSYKAIIVAIHNLCIEESLHKDLMAHGFMKAMDQISQTSLSGHVSASMSSHVMLDSNIPSSPGKSPQHHRHHKSYPTAMVYHGMKDMEEGRSQHESDTVLSSEYPLIHLCSEDIIFLTKAIGYIAASSSCHAGLVDGGIINIFKSLYPGLTETSRYEVACAVSNIASSKECRQKFVDQDAAEFIIHLATTQHYQTQYKCSLALGYLSEITKVNYGVVSSLLLMSLKAEDENSNDRKSINKSKESFSSSININNNNNNLNINNNGLPQISSGISSSTDFADTPRRALSFMIREGLKKRNTSKLLPVDQEDIDSDEEAPFNADYMSDKKRLKGEIESLHGDYSAYLFETIGFAISPESGGIASKLKIEMQLPSISQERQLNNAKKHEELVKSNNGIVNALPKDIVDHSAEILRNIHTPSSSSTSAHANGGITTSNSYVGSAINANEHSNEDHFESESSRSATASHRKTTSTAMKKKPIMMKMNSSLNLKN